MGFWSNFNFFGRNRIEQPQQELFLSFIHGKGRVLNYDPFKWYKENPVVFKAIDERSKAISNAQYYILTKDGEQIQTDLTAFLNKPNKDLTGVEFLYQLVTFMSIWGTSYTQVVRGSRFATLQNQSLENLEADKMVFDFKNKIPKVERLKGNDFTPEIYYRDGLLHPIDNENLLPIFDTVIFSNPYYSESRLKSLQLEVSNVQRNLEFKNTVLSSPTGIGMLTSDNKDANGSIPITTEEKKEMEEDLAKTYGAGVNQIPVRVTRMPVKYESTIPDLKSLKLDETQTISALNIFGHFGLPKELYPALIKGSTFENQSVSFKRFLQSEGQSLADKIARTFNDFYQPTDGLLKLGFNHMPIMQEDESVKQDVISKKIDNLVLALQNGAINQNEFNERVNLLL